MKNNVFIKITCFILVLFMLGTLALPVSAAALCTPTALSAVYDAEEGSLSISGTYKGIIQTNRVYMVSLVDANNRMISTKSPLGSELDKGNGSFEYSFTLTESALTGFTMPMKITLSCVTAGVIDPISAEVSEKADTFVLGDVNGDGSIDNLDASIILQYDAGILSDAIPSELGDTNNDGMVDNLDAVLILKYDAGLINEF